MTTQTPTRRPTVKHAMTATAMGLVTIRNAWRSYFRALAEARSEARR